MRICIILFFLLISGFINAQNETMRWYFGDKAGLNFDLGRLNLLTDSEMIAPAGSASISNEDGLLMFYTDGATVWNRNHQIMTNGAGLAGDTENFQSALIIPKPGDDNSYYLFYARSNSATDPLVTSGTFYAEIRFSAENPLGSVAVKNAFLVGDSPSEKLTAVHHKSGESFWLVVLTGDDNDAEKPKKNFRVYHITETGINRPPITTRFETGVEGLGSMKFSIDGSKLVVAGNTRNDTFRYVNFFNFNNETGVLTYIRNIIAEPPLTNWPPKGLEFSPNGKFFYVTADTGQSNVIMQYQLEDIEISTEPLVILYTRSGVEIESLQLANDQKIYVALSIVDSDYNFLGVIENPNNKGVAAGYRNNFVNVNPGFSKKGLPNFVQSYFASKIVTENQCYVDDFTFDATSYAPISDILWDFGDGNSKNGISVTHKYNAPGEYTVKGVMNVGSKRVTVYKVVEAYALPNLLPNQELIECDEDADGFSIFNLESIKNIITNPALGEEFFFYLSQNDLENDVQIEDPENFQNTAPNQQIFVKVVNFNGCFETSSFIINSRFVQLPPIADVFTCENSDGVIGNALGEFNTTVLETDIRNQLTIPATTTLTFFPTYLDAQRNLNPYENTFNSSTKTIYIKAQEANFSCGGIQSLNIIVNSEAKINLQEEYIICFNPLLKPPVIINGDVENDRFEWRNNEGDIISRNANFTLNSIGEFSLTVFKSENGLLCSNSKTFVVKNPEIAIFSQIDVNTEDEQNNIINISVDGNSNYEFSLDNVTFFGNATNHTFNNVNAGLRTVYVRDKNKCEAPIQTNVSVIGFKKYFTPNGDGENDYWNINGLDAASFRSVKVFIFDRFGKVIASITDFNSLGWDGTYNGKKMQSSNYWFKAEIIDNDRNIINETGNFSLIRN